MERHTDEATYRTTCRRACASRYFPKTANVLKRQLNRLAPDLKVLGIDVREARIGNVGTRIIVLESGVRPLAQPPRSGNGFPISLAQRDAHGTNPSKVVNLSSVSSAERLPSPETIQGNALRADDIADDIFTADDTTDDIADDISIADDNTKNIVSNRTAEHERVSRFADDTDDKNSPLTYSNRPRRFKIGDVVRYRGTSDNIQRQYAGNLTIYEFSKWGDWCSCMKPNGSLTSWIEFDDLEFVAV